MAARMPVQTCAKIAGVLFLLSFVAGGFGEAWVPMRLIVPGDAAATAKNLVASATMFRLGFVGYLIEAICDTGLTWVLYLLLRPVNRDLALLAVIFRVTSTTGFAMGEVLSFTALPVLGGSRYLQTFSTAQLESLAMLLLRTGSRAGEVFSMFYGFGSLILGYLVFRSGFLPRILGILLAISGLGFIASIFFTVLAPGFATGYFLAPALLSGIALTFWLLVKGVDVPKWEEAAALRGR